MDGWMLDGIWVGGGVEHLREGVHGEKTFLNAIARLGGGGGGQPLPG